MNTQVKNAIKAISGITTSDDLNIVIDALKNQQKVIRSQKNVMAKATFKVGDRVSATGRNGTITGSIGKINRTKAIVNADGFRYNVPLSMLKAA